MKKILILIILIFTLTILFATEENNLDFSKEARCQHTIRTQPLAFLFGMPNIQYEYRFSQKFAIEATTCFGKILFVDITKSYGVFGRIYKGNKYNKGLFLRLGVSELGVSYEEDKFDLLSYFIGGGYHKVWENRLSIDLFSGLAISDTAMQKYIEQDGNLTKTVTVGGSGLIFGSSIGFSF